MSTQIQPLSGSLTQSQTTKITKKAIDRIPAPTAPKVQILLRDTELKGFGVRISKHKRQFFLERRMQGRVRRMTLGEFGPHTVEQARQKAEEAIALIAKDQDPAQARFETRRAVTFGQLLDRYLVQHAPRKRSGHEDQKMAVRYLRDWKNRRLSSLRRADMVALHAQIGQRAPYAANRLLSLLRKMFNLAKLWELYHGENPVVGIERYPEEKRERFVEPRELPRVFQALAEEPNLFFQAVFLIGLLTGARKTEILTMQWEDVDLDQRLWRLPTTKAGRTHTLPLPKAVIKILRRLPRVHGNPYVFPGKYDGSHLVNVTKAWLRIRQRADLPDVRIHDLRRTLGSWLAGEGASLPLIGKALNHTNVSTTQVYARLDVEPVRRALEANATKMLNLAARADASSPAKGARRLPKKKRRGPQRKTG
jgi:integrase